MLTCLRVRDLAIIEALEVEFGPGLNVITGETGAGKSILIDALSLVVGARGRPELVRAGAAAAEVEALFDVAGDAALADQLADSGLEAEGELIARRRVLPTGRTRAYLNGRLASAGQLSDVVSPWVDISSQHEHHTLVDPATHLEFLDAFGELGASREAIAAAHRALKDADAALADTLSQLAARAERADLLRFQIREIEELGAEPGEDEELHRERDRLRHAEQLGGVGVDAEDQLYSSDGSVSEVLARLADRVSAAAELDPGLRPMADSLHSTVAQVEEVARDLGEYGRAVARDEERLAEVEERLVAIRRLSRRYGGSLEAVIAHGESARESLAALDHAEERVEELERARDNALADAARVAKKLSAARRRIASALGEQIGAELESLGMGGARVEVHVEPLRGREDALAVDGARLSATGIDRVEFLIAANKGEVPRPLAKIASGGELSRAMLAIKRVLSGVGRAGLYVFDEVDSGVGGAVAEVIGQKLADVARHHQVICITHLAQIAVYADRHFRVSKEVEDARTHSRIERLGDKARLEEVARMVGGIDITKRTRAAAKEMIRGAQDRLAAG